MSFINRKTVNGIADINDTGINILMKSTMTTEASITGVSDATGVVNGATVTYDSDLGFDPGSAGGVTFSSITGSSALDYEMQIVGNFETVGIGEANTNDSGSEGRDNTAIAYLITGKDGGGVHANSIEWSFTASETHSVKLHGSDTPITFKVHTKGKGVKTIFCLWAKGTVFGVLIDGVEMGPGTRTNRVSDQFAEIHFGSLNATVSPFVGYHISDAVVAKISPRFNVRPREETYGIFGDSFAVLSDLTNSNPRYDNTIGNRLTQYLAERGFNTRIFIDGHSGETVAVTGANDLQTSFAAFAANEYKVVIILAGNNDVTATSAQVNDATNGTKTMYEQLIQRCAFRDYPTNTIRTRTQRIIVHTPGSIKQKSSIDTAANQNNLSTVIGITKALPDDFDDDFSSSAGLVRVVDLNEILGDSVINFNYQGSVDGTDDDRHLSGQGGEALTPHTYAAIGL